MHEPKPKRRAGTPGLDDRYSTFLSLSGDGIARFELDQPLPADVIWTRGA